MGSLCAFVAAATCAVVVTGCSAERSDPPPPLTFQGTDNPVSCERLSSEQDPPPVTDFGTFMVDGAEAGCLVEGQQCQLGAAGGGCDAQLELAQCQNHLWILRCWSAPADDGGQKSEAGEAQDASGG